MIVNNSVPHLHKGIVYNLFTNHIFASIRYLDLGQCINDSYYIYLVIDSEKNVLRIIITLDDQSPFIFLIYFHGKKNVPAVQ